MTADMTEEHKAPVAGQTPTFSDLVGKVLVSIDRATNGEDNDTLAFVVDDGSRFVQYHSQSCCESVSIEDVAGDLSDLIGSPILMANEVSSQDDEGEQEWTFYNLATIKGGVTIRWFGSSNGYYSTSVYVRYEPAPTATGEQS